MENIVYRKPKKFHYSAAERKKFPFVAITMLIPLAHIIVFWFYVNLSSILLAFQDTRSTALIDQWPMSLYSFEKVFNDIISGGTQGQSAVRNILVMLGKSVLMWTNANIVCNVISLLTCFMLTKHMIGSRFFRTVYYIPGIVGGVVFSTIMTELYKAGGPVPTLLQGLGIDFSIGVERGGLLADINTAFPTMLTQQFLFGIGGGSMIIAGAFMRIPEEVFESARMDGCGFFRETFQIAIPCAWPTISTLMVFALCSIFVSDIGLYLYSPDGLYGLESIGFYMYTLRVGLSNNPNNTWIYGYGAALGILITVITIPVVYIGRWILNKTNDNVEF